MTRLLRSDERLVTENLSFIFTAAKVVTAASDVLQFQSFQSMGQVVEEGLPHCGVILKTKLGCLPLYIHALLMLTIDCVLMLFLLIDASSTSQSIFFIPTASLM